MSKRSLVLDPQPYQEEALLDVSTRFLGVSAGKRSGKSRLISILKALLLASIHPGKPGLIASPVYGMTRRNLVPIIRMYNEVLGLNIRGLNSKAPGTLEIDFGPHTSIIHLDVTIENFDRLNGLSLAWACVDECDKARRSDMEAFAEELIIRISDPYPGRTAQINFTGAPELNGWMAEFFIENPAPNKKLFKWSMMQNGMLSEEYKASILATIPESKQAGWVRGEPMYNTDGLVYVDFDPKENHTDLTINDILPHETIDAAWDINQGGCNVYFSVTRGKHHFTVLEWPKMHSTEKVLEKIGKQTWSPQVVLTCDPACTQVLPYIQKAKDINGKTLRNRIMTSAPDIEWRVTAMNIQFGTKLPLNGVPTRRHLVNTKICKVLTKCLQRQAYVKGEPDKKTWIDEAGTDISGPVDGVGYRVYRDFPYKPNGPANINLRGF